jgi:DNA-binding CsgD family transcriptional regulator
VVAMLMRSRSSLASARAAKHPDLVMPMARGIHLLLDDSELASVLRHELREREDLVEAAITDAAAVITDHEELDFANVGRERFLTIGAGRQGRNELDSLDPALILSAAAVVAAGYVLNRADLPGLAKPSGTIHLSQRELQVATLLVDGASNKLIARALDISVHTAKFHVTAVLEKLRARNRADAVSIILREGLVAL